MEDNTHCVVCDKLAKYTCPICLQKYCSVPCFKTHKEHCKKKPMEYLSVEAMNDDTIAEDLTFISNAQAYVHTLVTKRRSVLEPAYKAKNLHKKLKRQERKPRPMQDEEGKPKSEVQKEELNNQIPEKTGLQVEETQHHQNVLK
ncbi:hypothetical protein EIN_226170 [Entamoeba invadens IP1]|uniref:HIT-type domain-containing protein n=1 Tax=Entamoeba invadens IP1 TaxID=370355 RepID=A0A0A1U2J4_ENTIV|nr:hypothetical protein EIN_226170 [Entamoeba invadens IP1]ELP88254.1 hypothetical protein EIN_226170 [Entamoeba invadens IP1]|eukprot:XP_004255025.1 hypothetical protein EIN_226170 [Entamoeba invadens IP1]